ncbi:MAG TPA: hypothetical protein VGN61_15280 [Verrucomicrobiae bacterium]
MTWESFKWAWTAGAAANWHPVTWFSLLIDSQVYGLNPTGYHLTNVFLHLANTVLLFLLLKRLTGALGASFFVAAVFALHPLRVESVVWVAERKDVLSGFFFLLTVWGYVLWRQSKRLVFYGLSIVCFALGLMAKPMLVTVPFVLLLLDFWPLGRTFAWGLIWEKLPYAALAVGDGVATYLVQRNSGAMGNFQSLSLADRLTNVPVAYIRYIFKNFWPSGLAVYYPLRTVGLLEALGAVCILAAVTVLVVRRWRPQPYLAVGWFWFLGMLVPTIGIVQVGTQSMADRYTYLPCIGLWIMVAWWVAEHIHARSFLMTAGAMGLAACAVLTLIQERYWKDTTTLLMRDAALTGQHYFAYYNIGCLQIDKGGIFRRRDELQNGTRLRAGGQQMAGPLARLQ